MTKEEFLSLPEEEQEEIICLHLHQTIHQGEPPVKETAYEMGCRVSKLYNWASINDENLTRQPRPSQLIKLMHLKNNLSFLDFLEGLFCRAAFSVPKPSEDHTSINKATTKALKSFSGYMEDVSDLVDRLDDGELMFDPDWDQELKEAEIACRQAQARCESLLQTLRMSRGRNKLNLFSYPGF